MKNDTRRQLKIGFAFIIFYVFLENISYFRGIVKFLFSVVSPLVMGLIFAFLINILLKKYERKFKRRKLSLALSVVTIFIFITLFLFLIFPEIKKAIAEFAASFPEYTEKLNSIFGMVKEKTGLSGIDISGLKAIPEINTDDVINTVSKTLNTGADIAIGFVLSLYILAEKEAFCRKSCEIIKKVSGKYYPKIKKLAVVSDIVFESFITGQLTESLILGALCFLGMLILKIPYAVMISSLVCVTALVPVFGAFIGGGVGFLLILSVNPLKSLWFVAFFIILQQIEGNFIYPQIVGKSVGLPSGLVLCAVTTGAGLMGPVGVILSVPLTSVIYYYGKIP